MSRLFADDLYNLQNLILIYPSIEEVLGREQFYRQNKLPIELNDLIEEYCLDLDNLNGHDSIAWGSKVLFDEFSRLHVFPAVQLWKSKNSNPLNIRENEIILWIKIEKFRGLIKWYEKRFQIEWEEDKKVYFQRRRLAFDFILLLKNKRELVSSELRENFLKENDSISELNLKKTKLYSNLKLINNRRIENWESIENFYYPENLWSKLEEEYQLEIDRNDKRIAEIVFNRIDNS